MSYATSIYFLAASVGVTDVLPTNTAKKYKNFFVVTLIISPAMRGLIFWQQKKHKAIKSDVLFFCHILVRGLNLTFVVGEKMIEMLLIKSD